MKTPSKSRSPHGKWIRRPSIRALATAALVLCLSASASADTVFCTFGSGAGQCDQPRSVAVDRSNGRVYVVDGGNARVNAFDEDGNSLFSFGSPGTAPGQLKAPQSIAVDNDPASSAFHDVYVIDTPAEGATRVQRFGSAGDFILTFGSGELNSSGGSVAVGPGGTVYVRDTKSSVTQIKKFNPSGALLGSSTLPGSGFTRDLEVDSNKDAYVISGSGGGEKYELTEPNATLLYELAPSTNARALGLDSEDNVFIQNQGDDVRIISMYDASGDLLKRFGYNHIQFRFEGLSVGAVGAVFGSEEWVGVPSPGNRVIVIPPALPGPITCCLSATAGNTRATLEGRFNPEGKATTFHLEYITQALYEAGGNSFGTGTVKTPESPASDADFSLQSVKVPLGCSEPTVPPQPSCLLPETTYRYRLVASNADGEDSTEEQFTTRSPLELTETFATDTGTDAAGLHATVNPLGIPATAYFEYIDEASYQADLAKGEGHDGFDEAAKVPNIDGGAAPINVGAGEVPKTFGAQLDSLQPGTAYRYRVVVSDPFITTTGPTHDITTFPLPAPPTNSCPNTAFRTGASARLPDCRAYEMVSPVDKNGNDIKTLVQIVNFPARLDQSSEDGNRFAYSSSTAFGDAVSAPYTSEYMATRAEDGWSTHAINPPRESTSLTTNPIIKFDVQYKYFNTDLSTGWLFQDAEPVLDDCAPEGFINLYRRDNVTGEYEALIPTEPLGPIVGSGTGYRLELQGVSADGTRAVFRADAKLTENSTDYLYQVYEHVRDEGCGELRLVSALPSGKANSQSSSVGGGAGPSEYREAPVERAVSSDGSRVFWASAESARSGLLYVRVNADREQSAVSAGKCTEPEKACTLQISAEAHTNFWTAATNGSKAIYSLGDGSLYEYDVDKALAGEAANMLIAGGIASGLGGVAGANQDASRIFFVSTEQINGEGEAGERNFYYYDSSKSGADRYRFIATLEHDKAEVRLGPFVVGNEKPIQNGVRLTADGSHLAFVSDRSLTGYDTKDATSGQPALEVYLYDVETGKLACISCNPSGARPAGRVFSSHDSRWVSAQLPPGESQSFTPRVLSPDGNRLFFESFEALLPRDTNGKADVYEWQRASGAEECKAAGAELYVPSAGGCLGLISSGQSPIDSEIADASPDGSDVFIRTASSLVPQDPGLVDIYDARVNGGLPQPPGIPAACEGEACQGPLAPPNDPTPASSSFQGAGNVVEKPKAKKKKRAHKKQKAKKHQKKASHKRGARR